MEDDVKGKGLTGVSVLMIAYVFFGMEDNEISIFGIKFSGDDDKLLIAWSVTFCFFFWRYYQSINERIQSVFESFWKINEDEYWQIAVKKGANPEQRKSAKWDVSRKKIRYGNLYIALSEISNFRKRRIYFAIGERHFFNILGPIFFSFLAVIALIIEHFFK